jgi:hypothetical protein
LFLLIPCYHQKYGSRNTFWLCAGSPTLEQVFSIDEAIRDVDYIDKSYNPRAAIKQISFKPKTTLYNKNIMKSLHCFHVHFATFQAPD